MDGKFGSQLLAFLAILLFFSLSFYFIVVLFVIIFFILEKVKSLLLKITQLENERENEKKDKEILKEKISAYENEKEDLLAQLQGAERYISYVTVDDYLLIIRRLFA